MNERQGRVGLLERVRGGKIAAGRRLNERGVALIMALVLAAIGLALGATVVYMVRQSATISGIERRYATALGAAKGSADLATSLIDALGQDPDGTGSFISVPCPARVTFKIQNPTSEWGAAPGCVPQYDMLVNPLLDSLGPPDQQFRVYVTIVDTIAGNTPPTGTPNMRVTGVVNTGAVMGNPSHYPYMYRVDVHSERPNPQDAADPTNPYDPNRRPLDVADVTMLYAY